MYIKSFTSNRYSISNTNTTSKHTTLHSTQPRCSTLQKVTIIAPDPRNDGQPTLVLWATLTVMLANGKSVLRTARDYAVTGPGIMA